MAAYFAAGFGGAALAEGGIVVGGFALNSFRTAGAAWTTAGQVGGSHIITRIGPKVFIAIMGTATAFATEDYGPGATIKSAEREIARRASQWKWGNLMDLGETDKFGNITLKNGLEGKVFEETLRHENVHSFLSPAEGGAVQEARANFGVWAYGKSDLLRYIEEAAAETYATRSLTRGLAFPVTHRYVSAPRTLVEALLYGASIYGTGMAGREVLYD